MKQPKDRMRGVAYDRGVGAIEFGDEPEHYFRKIVHEHLKPAKQCGMATKNAPNGGKSLRLSMS